MIQFLAGGPAATGYRMPAEWELHQATWLSWPRVDGISFPAAYEEVIPTFIQIVDSLRDSEIVRINVSGDEQEAEVRQWLHSIDTSHVELVRIATDEPWCRDHGPTFVTRERDPRLAIVHWEYNAWGNKYQPYEHDRQVPARIAAKYGLPVFRPGIVMEGGSFDVNGAGALLTTTSCLLNKNRNPDCTREQIEQALADQLAVREIIWLGDGIAGDDTDGHIDDITRFVSSDTILTVVEPDPADPNHLPLAGNLAVLQGYRFLNGKAPRIKTLPMPSAVVREGQRLPASYANFYIANRVVLLPVFCVKQDTAAIAVVQSCFPDRKVVAINCRSLVWGLGAFHCLTQQEPAVSPSSTPDQARE